MRKKDHCGNEEIGSSACISKLGEDKLLISGMGNLKYDMHSLVLLFRRFTVNWPQYGAKRIQNYPISERVHIFNFSLHCYRSV